MRQFAWGWLVLLLAWVTPGAGAAERDADLPPVATEEVFAALNLRLPVDLEFAPAQLDLAYIVEQKSAQIHVFKPIADGNAEALEQQVFLDLSDRVAGRHNEEGLLCMALDPDFAENGYFYVYYSAQRPRRGVLSRFQLLDGDPRQGDPESELIILSVKQPWGNHNGADVVFGPDGYLYIGLGDGGAAGDPQGHGQERGTLLGSILRLDVSQASAETPYQIPADNPFVGHDDARDEIWAYGLRNPWRMSFAPETGDLWAADVGQDTREEVNIIVPGGNYGWNVMEGTHNFRGRPTRYMIPPVFEYGHDLRSGGKSITGGYVYRGSAVPDLLGAYICGDYVSGRMWAVRRERRRTRSEVIAERVGQIASFAEDPDGELYLVDHRGSIYRLQPR